MTDHSWETIQRHKGGEPVRIYSICSAHPRRTLPLPLIGQFLSDQYGRVRAGELRATLRALVLDKIRDAPRPYAAARIPVLRTLSTTASNQGELLV
jgi:D-tagatose-1,6-bisphosphate aldolase subunit GatZ/KbaZ